MSNKVDAADMKPEKKRQLIPNRRFPEFQAMPEWKEKRLIDVASKKVKWGFIGGPFGSNLKASDYTASGIRIIQLQNIGDAEFIDDYKIFTSEQKADELLSCNIYPGEIILSKMGDPVARACLIPNNHQRYVMCSDGIRLVVEEKKYNKYFIYSFINSSQFRRRAEKAATGSTRKRIGIDELKNLLVIAPELNEQQKIADCLSSLDDLIVAQSQKLNVLKNHKNGLLNQLFPEEGETLPKLRFPEFRDAPEWTQSILGPKTTKVGSGITPKGGEINYKVSGRPFIRSQNVGWGELILDDVVFIDEATHATFPTTEIKKGDVLLNITGASIGRSVVADSRIHGGNVNQHVCIIRLKNKGVTSNFLNQYLISRYGQKQIDSFQAGGNRQGLNFAQIRSFSIPLPPMIEEQVRVADCLFSLDELIAVQTEKIDALKAHKGGLMQQLFPFVEDGAK